MTNHFNSHLNDFSLCPFCLSPFLAKTGCVFSPVWLQRFQALLVKSKEPCSHSSTNACFLQLCAPSCCRLEGLLSIDVTLWPCSHINYSSPKLPIICHKLSPQSHSTFSKGPHLHLLCIFIYIFLKKNVKFMKVLKITCIKKNNMYKITHHPE